MVSFFQNFPVQMLYVTFFFLVRATYPGHLIIWRIILAYKKGPEFDPGSRHYY
jgi:hypothetical protein